MRITNLQKKVLADLLRDAGLNMVDFEVSGSPKEFKIKYRYDYFSFSLDRLELQRYSIVILPVNTTVPVKENGDWEYLKARYKIWLDQLSKELVTPTGWEHFQPENYLGLKRRDLNNLFTSEEKEQAKDALNTYSQYIHHRLPMDGDAKQVILAKLEELSGKIDAMNKFDWKSLLIGTMANVVMVLGLPSEVSGMLWEGLKTAFGRLRING
ncbi:hypothetical protein [Echinicola rosea]|uniref:DUF4304 domain-containing protein n=1 Tax=Echinicola rosea TaxID=1807691 RepID=A0ABQ1UYF7_9BACT|nr:hypothetical protein [Echinicola rosea]GGF30366.1 hypothetical protein GCM10011339_18190 [Echinicola rosea]